jgi:hypothetical protein
VAGEDPGAFAELHAGFKESLHPFGRLEEELVERAASITWRLRRAAAMEADVLEQLGKRSDMEDTQRIIAFIEGIASRRPKEEWQEAEGSEELSGFFESMRLRELALNATPSGEGVGRGLLTGEADRSLALLRRYEVTLQHALRSVLEEFDHRQTSRRNAWYGRLAEKEASKS